MSEALKQKLHEVMGMFRVEGFIQTAQALVLLFFQSITTPPVLLMVYLVSVSKMSVICLKFSKLKLVAI
jgi:hypothetical protein